MKTINIIIVWILAVIMSIMTASACQEFYDITEPVVILDNIETYGAGADCNITIYDNESTLINNTAMERTGLMYTYNLGMVDQGFYHSNIDCNLSNSSFIGECNFEVGGESIMLSHMIIYGFLMSIVYFIFYRHKKKRNVYITGFLFMIISAGLWYLNPTVTLNLLVGLIGMFLGAITVLSPKFTGI